jgi:hypothetical protein
MILSSTGLYAECSGSFSATVSYFDKSSSTTSSVGKTSNGSSRSIISAPASSHTIVIDAILLSNVSDSAITLSLYAGSDSSGVPLFNKTLAAGASIQHDGTRWYFPDDTSSSSPVSTELPAGEVFIGNSSGVATARALSGAVTVTYSGVTSLSNSGVAAGSYTKVTTGSDGRITHGDNPTTLLGYGITDAAEAGLNSSIKGLSGLIVPLSIAQGGTGANTTAAAKTALGAASAGANSDITSLSGLITALSIGQGGTGAKTAGAARTALGLSIGQDVQAHNSTLDALSALVLSDGNLTYTTDHGWSFSSGTYLTDDLTTGYLLIGNADNVATPVQISGDFVISYTGAGTLRKIGGKSIGYFATGTDASNLTGLLSSSRLSGMYTGVIGVGALSAGTWKADVIGVAYGGTGAATAAGARIALGVSVGSDVQAYNADLDAIAALSTTGYAKRTAANTWSLVSGIPNSDLANSSLTIAGHSVALGGTQAIAFGDLSSTPTTLAGYGIADGVDLSSPQTLFHKTLASPHINATADSYSGLTFGTGLFLGVDTDNSLASIFHQGGGAVLEVGAQDHITFTTGAVAGSATERMRITNAGNVGIKTISPTQAFEVVGNIAGRTSNATNSNSDFRLLGGAYTGNLATLITFNGTNGSNQINYGGATGAGEPATEHIWCIGSAGATGAGTEQMRLTSSGLTVNGNYAPATDNTYTLGTAALRAAALFLAPNTPTSSSASGSPGQIAADANYVYVCTAANTWKRTALTTW